MLNVYGEIDYDYGFDEYTDLKIEMGNYSVGQWHSFIEDNGLEALYCAQNTVIFSPENVTGLEHLCYDAIKNKVDDHGILLHEHELTDVGNYFDTLGSKNKYFGIKGEGAVDAFRLFKWLDQKLAKTQSISSITVDQSYFKRDPVSRKISLNCGQSEIRCEKYLVCAGTANTQILECFDDVLPSLHGVGTALVIKNDPGFYKNLPMNTVFRTPNRGGTCGLHVVPRDSSNQNGSYYVGAGSAICYEWPSAPRFGTVEYLINSFQNQLRPIDRDLSLSEVHILQGSRPVSLDGKPIIGPLNDYENIFVIGGTKRDGFTLVFSLLAEVKNWIQGQRIGYEQFRPNRLPITFWDREFATEVYAQNKLTGLIEHKTTNGKSDEQLYRELLEEADIFYEKIYKKYPYFKNKGIHPELLNVIRV